MWLARLPMLLWPPIRRPPEEDCHRRFSMTRPAMRGPPKEPWRSWPAEPWRSRPQWRPRRLARLWRAPRRSRFFRMRRCQRRANGCGRRFPRRPILSSGIASANAKIRSRPQWRTRSRPQWRAESSAVADPWLAKGGVLRGGGQVVASSGVACFSGNGGRMRMRRSPHKRLRCSSVHLRKGATYALMEMIAKTLIALAIRMMGR